MEKIDLIKNFILKENFKDAELGAKQLVINNSKNIDYHLLLGYVYEKQNKLELALKSYKNAKKIKVTDTVLNLISNIYIKSNNLEKAFSELSNSIKINNKNPKTLNNFGLLLIAKQKELQSIKFFENAINLDKNFMDPKYNLLEILEKTNKINLFKKTILNESKVFPKDRVLNFFMGLYLSLEKKYLEALNILESVNFLNYKQNWEYRRLNLIGKIYGELKNYKVSFNFHKEANKFLLKKFGHKKFNEKKYLNKIKQYSKIVKKGNNIFKVTKINNDRLVFVIGFPRSGTTLLESILSKHSKIEALEEKPLIENTLKDISLNNKINCTNIEEYNLKEKYLDQLSQYFSKETISNKIIVDKMPLNLIYARAIYNIFPEAKIIFCLRHPLDVILSCYFQNFVLNDAMVNFLDLKRTTEIYSLTMSIFEKYSEINSKNIAQVKYENIISNFENELEKICDFIGIKQETNMKKFYMNSNKRVRTASYNQVNQPIYKTSKYKWLNYKIELEEIKKNVQKWIDFYSY